MKKVLFLFLPFLLANCSSKLDWDQAEEFQTVQRWDGSIFQAKLSGKNFYVNGNPLPKISDTIPFQVFDNREFRNAFVKIELETYAKNALPASFEMQIIYLDDQVEIHRTTLNINAGSGQNPSENSIIETIDTTFQPPFTQVNQIAVDLYRNDANDIENSTDTLTVGLNARLFTRIK